MKISEIDCKTPDQVRYIIRTNQQNIHNSADKNTVLISLNILALFAFRIFVWTAWTELCLFILFMDTYAIFLTCHLYHSILNLDHLGFALCDLNQL